MARNQTFSNEEKYDMLLCFAQSNEDVNEASELYLLRIKIGAPRATYNYGAKNIYESGIVYNCPYMKPCHIHNNIDYKSNNNFFPNTNLTSSMTGASMDLSHKYKSLAVSSFNYHYVTERNSVFIPGGIFLENIKKNTILQQVPLLHPIRTSDGSSYFGRAQTGFSFHFLQDQNKLLVGAPGVYNLIGTVLLIENKEKEKNPWQYKVMIPSGAWSQYTGYALTSGYFQKKGELWYVAGLPGGKKDSYAEMGITYGSVVIFTFTDKKKKVTSAYEFDTVRLGKFYGTQAGEYFGASLAAGDLNGDNIDDLIVGAPFRTNDVNGYNHGSVYVIYGHKTKKLQLDAKNRIDGTVNNGLFGYAMMFLGDLNKDGYGDVAVSAPYKDNFGTVYIYTYNNEKKSLVVSQEIPGKTISPHLRGFGMSFSRPVDIDDNQYPDIAIGSPISGNVVVLRSKPTASVDGKIRTSSTINKKDKALSIQVCFSYKTYPEDSLSIIRTITVDQSYRRFAFDNSTFTGISNEKQIKINNGSSHCENVTVFKIPIVTNYKDRINIALSYKIPENKEANVINPISISNVTSGHDTFCKTCPVQSQKTFTPEVVVWDLTCEQGKTCQSEIDISAKFGNLSKENTFILGSKEPFQLEVTISNSGDPALTPVLDILLPTEAFLRRCPVDCECTDVNKITCDLGERLENKASYNFELNVEDDVNESEVKFSLHCSTKTMNIGDKNKLIKILNIEREVDFEITGRFLGQLEKFDNATERTVSIQNIITVQKAGKSPVPEIPTNILVPYKIKNSEGQYKNFAEAEVLRNSESLFECQNITDYDKRSAPEVMLEEFSLTDSDIDSMENNTYSMIDPKNIFHLNCTMENIICGIIRCQAGPLADSQTVAKIYLDIEVNFQYLKDLMKPEDSVLLITQAYIDAENFTQCGDRSDSTAISSLISHQIKKDEISLMTIIESLIAGLLILALIVIILVKVGFFERKDQKKLKELKSEALQEDAFVEEMIEAELRNHNGEQLLRENIIQEEPIAGPSCPEEELVLL